MELAQYQNYEEYKKAMNRTEQNGRRFCHDWISAEAGKR